ncbi:HPP family protein [methanogenic archaeon mixed culture ISO4-G1]|nr:HPP family protein [methanogenic archaeon mixed culture ISO4-G1]
MKYLENAKKRFDAPQIIRAAGSFVGIAFLGILWAFYDLPLLVASLGSTAVTLFALPKAPAARPRSAILGQFVSAVCGWVIQYLLGSTWYACAAAVALSLIVMVLLDCVHPPGGATALTAVLTPQPWTFIIAPVTVGVVFLVIVAAIANKACEKYEGAPETAS